MRSINLLTSIVATAKIVTAERPFISEPDTGLEIFLDGIDWAQGTQPALKDMRGLSDFDFAARQKLNNSEYSFYRTAAGGEWSERWHRDLLSCFPPPGESTS